MTVSKQMLRFCVSGLAITAFHVLSAVTLVTRLDLEPGLANGIAFISATVVSYMVNTLWSFSSNPDRQNMLRFASVSLFGFFLTISISAMAQSLALHYLFGIGLVVMVVTPTTFLLHRCWTYR